MLKTATTNANSWTGLESVSPHFKCKGEAVQKLSGGAFERNLLFPLISLENLVKIGRCNSNAPGFFLRRVAQIPHCFHSCLARRTRLKVGGGGGGGGGWSCCDQLMCKDEKWEAERDKNQYVERLTQPAADRQTESERERKCLKRKVITESHLPETLQRCCHQSSFWCKTKTNVCIPP